MYCSTALNTLNLLLSTPGLLSVLSIHQRATIETKVIVILNGINVMSNRCEFISTWVWAPTADAPSTPSPAAALRLPGSGQTPGLRLWEGGRHHGGILSWSPGLQHSRGCAPPRWEVSTQSFLYSSQTLSKCGYSIMEREVTHSWTGYVCNIFYTKAFVPEVT